MGKLSPSATSAELCRQRICMYVILYTFPSLAPPPLPSGQGNYRSLFCAKKFRDTTRGGGGRGRSGCWRHGDRKGERRGRGSCSQEGRMEGISFYVLLAKQSQQRRRSSRLSSLGCVCRVAGPTFPGPRAVELRDWTTNLTIFLCQRARRRHFFRSHFSSRSSRFVPLSALYSRSSLLLESWASRGRGRPLALSLVRAV